MITAPFQIDPHVASAIDALLVRDADARILGRPALERLAYVLSLNCKLPDDRLLPTLTACAVVGVSPTDFVELALLHGMLPIRTTSSREYWRAGDCYQLISKITKGQQHASHSKNKRPALRAIPGRKADIGDSDT
jgi:hypothetical protein